MPKYIYLSAPSKLSHAKPELELLVLENLLSHLELVHSLLDVQLGNTSGLQVADDVTLQLTIILKSGGY